MTELSVIIPTRNRKAVLARCLAALAGQVGVNAGDVEFIVIDDGSEEVPTALIEEMAALSLWPLRYYRQPPQGPAAARNLGIEKARGRLVHFINDDTIAAPDLLARHIACHAQHPQAHWAVLGLFTWYPELEITPFMRWAERSWFKYDQLLARRLEPDFTFFFTCNISLKRDFLLEHGAFDPEFGGPALEDTELGYRLWQKGLRLVFCPKAVGYHDHPTDLRAACQRMEMVGRWSNVVVKKVPPHLVIDRFWPSIVRYPGMTYMIPRLIEPLARWLEHKAAIHPINKMVTTYYFVRGAAQGAPQQ